MNYSQPHDPADDATDDSTRETLFADEETESAYREAASKMLSVTLSTITWVRQAKTCKEMMMRLDLAAWLFLDDHLSSKSLAAVAKLHHRTRAATSHAVLNLEASLDLPPGIGQKLRQDRATYSNSRTNKLK